MNNNMNDNMNNNVNNDMNNVNNDMNNVNNDMNNVNNENDPIKDLLFDYVKESETIPKLLIEKKFDQIIHDVVQNCHDRAVSMGGRDTAVGVLATAILHYLLTCALFTSQRKLEYRGNRIDIVIPDIKTLEKDPKKTLLVCIPKSSDVSVIRREIADLEKIQPHKDNIWVVLASDLDVGKRTFVLSRNNDTFSRIIFEIGEFVNQNGTGRFKILRV